MWIGKEEVNNISIGRPSFVRLSDNLFADLQTIFALHLAIFPKVFRIQLHMFIRLHGNPIVEFIEFQMMGESPSTMTSTRPLATHNWVPLRRACISASMAKLVVIAQAKAWRSLLRLSRIIPPIPAVQFTLLKEPSMFSLWVSGGGTVQVSRGKRSVILVVIRVRATFHSWRDKSSPQWRKGETVGIERGWHYESSKCTTRSKLLSSSRPLVVRKTGWQWAALGLWVEACGEGIARHL